MRKPHKCRRYHFFPRLTKYAMKKEKRTSQLSQARSSSAAERLVPEGLNHLVVGSGWLDVRMERSSSNHRSILTRKATLNQRRTDWTNNTTARGSETDKSVIQEGENTKWSPRFHCRCVSVCVCMCAYLSADGRNLHISIDIAFFSSSSYAQMLWQRVDVSHYRDLCSMHAGKCVHACTGALSAHRPCCACVCGLL